MNISADKNYIDNLIQIKMKDVPCLEYYNYYEENIKFGDIPNNCLFLWETKRLSKF